MKLDNIKVTIPIPAISDVLFNEKLSKHNESEETEEGMAQEAIDKINDEARKEYKYNHPTIKEFIKGK